MNTPNNKKRKKSQEQIEKIFLQLIQKKNIEEISVSTICELSGLNRSTFYSNYIDIYDLGEKVKQQMEVEFAQFQLSNNAKQNPDGYLNMFRYIKDNQIFFKTYFKLEEISKNVPTQYRIELAEKYYDNKFIELVLEVNQIKEIVTKKNDVMAFIKASDEYKSVDLTLFPKIYDENKNLEIYDIIKIYGKVEKRFDNYQII